MSVKSIITFSIIAVFAILAGCKSHKIQESAKNTIPQGKWILITIGEKALNGADFQGEAPSIVFKDSSAFSGSTGCNQYLATYKHSPESITIKMGPLTKMACPGDGEQMFLSAIKQTNRADVKEGILTFYENEKSLMTFKRAN